MNIPRHRALALLAKCTGDEIWSLDTCRAEGVPPNWVEELADTFESGFQTDRQTIYVEGAITNQYHGVRDVDLAIRIGRSIGLDIGRITATTIGRRSIVQAITDAVMEGE